MNLNVKEKILKHMKENIEEYICDLGVGKDFLNKTLKSKPYRIKIDKF